MRMVVAVASVLSEGMPDTVVLTDGINVFPVAVLARSTPFPSCVPSAVGSSAIEARAAGADLAVQEGALEVCGAYGVAEESHAACAATWRWVGPAFVSHIN
jgi:hypothetical protein